MFCHYMNSRNNFEHSCVILGGLSPIEYHPEKVVLVGGIGNCRAPSKGGGRG
jgi:hypothetical protein